MAQKGREKTEPTVSHAPKILDSSNADHSTGAWKALLYTTSTVIPILLIEMYVLSASGADRMVVEILSMFAVAAMTLQLISVSMVLKQEWKYCKEREKILEDLIMGD